MKPTNYNGRVLAVETAAGAVMLLAIWHLSREDVLSTWEAPVAVLVAIVGFVTWWEVARWHQIFQAGQVDNKSGKLLELNRLSSGSTDQSVPVAVLRATDGAPVTSPGHTTLILRGTKRWVTGITGQHRSLSGQ